jgi:mono/diheme cytochrome c family protein
VTYAKQDTGAHDNLSGAGLGLLNVFDTQGTLKTHLVAVGGALNAPWGIALAPPGFGTLSNALLIGNFGDGVINAYDPVAGTFLATLLNATGQPIAIPGLWGIAFGNGVQRQATTTLYFTAGANAEADGLYGRIDVGATPPDVVAPTATLTSPAQSATVSGTVSVTATASDNVGVASVKFLAGTTVIGTATTAPYSVSWDTTTAAAGSIALTAQALDAAGNAGTSAAVTVSVSNPAPPATQSFAQLQTQLFTPICSGCHSGTGTTLPGSMNLTAGNAYASLVNVASVEQAALKRVRPSDPTDSYVIQKLEGTTGISGQRMPLGGPFLDQATINEVITWISQGAANN